MEKITKAMDSEIKGNKTFAIFEMEENEPSKYPVISFGIKKAKAILKHLEDLKTWVEANDKK